MRTCDTSAPRGWAGFGPMTAGISTHMAASSQKTLKDWHTS